MKAETLEKVLGRPGNQNTKAFLSGMEVGGKEIKWDLPVVQAHLLGQVCHESGGFVYDREIWGPTDVQRRYEDRADLGHSTRHANEAFMFRGKGPMQVTGRDNHRQFYEWADERFPNVPNFELEPDAILTDPWEGLSVVWYWQTRNLTKYALANDLENITKRINGGYNGLADRMRWFGRAALALLGRPATGLVAYQRDKGLVADNVPGTNTRAALFHDLQALVTPPEAVAPGYLHAEAELRRLRAALGSVVTVAQDALSGADQAVGDRPASAK